MVDEAGSLTFPQSVLLPNCLLKKSSSVSRKASAPVVCSVVSSDSDLTLLQLILAPKSTIIHIVHSLRLSVGILPLTAAAAGVTSPLHLRSHSQLCLGVGHASA